MRQFLGPESMSGRQATLSSALSKLAVSLAARILDTNPAPNTISEAASNGTVLPITLSVVNGAGGVTYSNWQITAQSIAGTFAINATTGELTVANSANLDYETLTTHSITVSVTGSDASVVTAVFSISITDIAEAVGGDDLAILMMMSNTEFTGYLQ